MAEAPSQGEQCPFLRKRGAAGDGERGPQTLAGSWPALPPSVRRWALHALCEEVAALFTPVVALHFSNAVGYKCPRDNTVCE